MDYLSSLNISYLPEHQTKLNHNDKLIKKLEQQSSSSSSSSSNLNLGINVCCNCASSNITIQCGKCKRIKYCSKRCRKEDSTTTTNTLSINNDHDDDMDGYDDEPICEGHTTIICSLLNICNIDEYVEDIILKQGDKRKKNPNAKATTKTTKEAIIHCDNINKKDFEESEIRIKSEYESYPATISDFLMEDWLIPSLQQQQKQNKNVKKRKHTTANTNNAITIHIIGASDDGELCTTFLDTNNIITTYYDALSDIMEIQQWNEINLCFIGPEINNNATNKSNNTKTWKINDTNYKLTISTYKGDYSDYDSNNNNPDIVIFFNPGFTCLDDYETWESSLDAIPNNIPFLITTNTQMEAMSDLQYLYDKQFITSLPSFLNDDDGGHDEDDDDKKSVYIFNENPSAGLRVRQSNTMANDLYRKSGWMFGGIFHNIKKSTDSSNDSLLKNKNENKISSSSKSNSKKNNLKDCDENDSNNITDCKKQKKKFFI